MSRKNVKETHCGVWWYVWFHKHTLEVAFSMAWLPRYLWLSCTKYQQANLTLRPSRAVASPRTAVNADDHLTHSKTMGQIWGWINMQRRAPCWPLLLNAFPSPAVSCCPVTRCRGRQVYLVWQVTLHPGPLQSHVRLTLMLCQLPQVIEDRMHLCLNASSISMRASFE